MSTLRLGEVVILIHQMDPALQLGFDTNPITPISGMSKDDAKVSFNTAGGTPMTVQTFRQHAAHFDNQLTVFNSAGDRLFGFRQANQWLLFK